MKEIQIGFTGDVAFSRYYKDRVERRDLVAEDLVAFLKSNDYNVFNIEGAVCAPTCTGYFIHNNPPACVDALAAMKPNIWNLANNHMMDAGPDGCMETIRHAQEQGWLTFGAGANEAEAVKPLILNEAGGIAFIGMGYQPKCVPADETTPGCSSWDKTELIRAAVAQAKQTCRWCVAVIHGGREFCDIPMQDVRDRYRAYLDMGVDVIVAHHPHVPQNWEKVGDKYIFYSLGNFIFDTDYQRAQFHTDTGVLLRLFFSEERVRFEAVGTKIHREDGKITQAPLPVIFTELTEADYAALYPYAAMRFREHVIKRELFMEPERFSDGATEENVAVIEKEENEEFPGFDEVVALAKSCDPDALGAKYGVLKEYLV